MTKKLHNLTEIPITGLLTNAQRIAIENKEIKKDMKWKLLDPDKGRPAQKLKAVANDLSLISVSPVFDIWKHEYQIVFELMNIEGIISKIRMFQPMFRRIAAIMENGKRKFYLKKIEPNLLVDSRIKTKSILLEILLKGLKQNERKLIKEYIEKCGYNFPLDENKKYEWSTVTKLLKEQMKPKPIQIEDKVRKNLESRMNMAWSMIKKKIDLNELISKTGFGIQLISYSSTIQNMKKDQN